MGFQALTPPPIPQYLQSYVVEQDYQRYTARDQAVWRFIMRQSREFLREHAHPVYLSGLESTGISVEEIPCITDMSEKLGKVGWGAVCVEGFIPPLAFLEFQANQILPIAAGMRTLEHLAYTPAPDIVHEAAGHAPILADPSYREYLKKYAVVAKKAIFSIEDIHLYEAIRCLSDLKENPDASAHQIEEAEQNLSRASKAITWVSEAAQVARMFWWTVEYGLMGALDNPLIYGAGLLSSLGESRDCLEKDVKKLSFGVSCMEQSYDITEPQPHLYVAKDFKHLTQVLTEFEKSLAFKKGGIESLALAQKARYITTTQFENGLAVSGELERVETKGHKVKFLKWRGPVQISVAGRQLAGHGSTRHSEGFSAPFGAWQGIAQKSPNALSDSDLLAIGVQIGQRCRIELASQISIEGILKENVRHPETQDLLVLTFTDCTVRDNEQVYFEAAWGDFDFVLLGQRVLSVYGGAADLQAFNNFNFGQATSNPMRTSAYSSREKEIFAIYQEIRAHREQLSSKKLDEKVLIALTRSFIEQFSEEWLLGVEILELARELKIDTSSEWLQDLLIHLQKFNAVEQERFIEFGVQLASTHGVK